MPSSIHPTAIVHPSAQIGNGVEVGPFAVIGEDVVLHPGVQVGPHAIIECAEIGERTRVHAHAFVGTAPQDLKYRGEKTRLEIGSDCIIRECVTLNRGTDATGVTKIGSKCLFMAYSHVAHDCVIGNEVILANSVAVAGHCVVDDWCVIGGMVGLHQFVRVGKLAMVGAGAMVPLDIPPFTMAQGDRAKLVGFNLIGLKRRGYSSEAVSDLKRVYRLLFNSQQPFQDALQHLIAQPASAGVQEFLTFLSKSTRGITRPESRTASRPEGD